jgi:hypothetical protein
MVRLPDECKKAMGGFIIPCAERLPLGKLWGKGALKKNK